jgi:hypothetical protein
MDWMLTNPQRPLSECAEAFNVTQPWLSTIIHSDVFRRIYDVRRDELSKAITHKMAKVALKALEKLDDTLDSEELDPAFILDATDRLLARSGYAANNNKGAAPGTVIINNNGTVDQALLANAREKMRVVSTVEQPSLPAPVAESA